MTKSAINRTWIVGLATLAVGLIVAAVSIGLMLGYGGTFTARAAGNGYDFVPNYDSFFWTTVMAMIGGFLVTAVGGLVQLAACVVRFFGSCFGRRALSERSRTPTASPISCGS